MKTFFQKIIALDRRWIFLLLLVTLFFPIACPLNLPGLKPSPGVQKMYDYVEAMPAGQTMLLSFDFDPASAPELQPMAEAILRHAFRKRIKVVAMGLWVTGLSLEKEIVDRIAREANAEAEKKGLKIEYGVDYINLGWKPGNVAVITGMGENLYSTFPTDTKGKALAEYPIMKDLRRLKDFNLVVSIAAGSPGIDTWIAFGSDKYKFKIGGGTTAVQSPAMSPYLQAGQLVGLIPAMRGAAEYELLIDNLSSGSKGMDAISLGHFLIVALIVLGNIAYFATRGGSGGAR